VHHEAYENTWTVAAVRQPRRAHARAPTVMVARFASREMENSGCWPKWRVYVCVCAYRK
jgi:hypothetical protein